MKKTKKSSKLIITITSTVLLVSLVTFVGLFLESSNSRDNQDLAKQKEMMALVLEGGRLSRFPVSARNIYIKTEGNSFTRSFRASFSAPKDDIQAWINDSPGLNETTPQKLSDNKVQYFIAPSGGANKVEVTIDYGLNQVEIYVSWS